MAGKVNYDDRQFAVYARGRALSPAMRLRPFSTFEHLTEPEIAAGMAAMDAAVAQETDPQPIEGASDLLVLGR
jgi:hypothetical protein